MVQPETRYAKSGDIHIAYQVMGDGPIDLVLVPGFFSHVEHSWEEPSFAHFLRRLTSFSRLIVFDARGTGLSDRAAQLPAMEQQMDGVLDDRGTHVLRGVPGAWRLFSAKSAPA